jgi:phosphoglycerate dehydrogenase-like enzyme
MTVLPMPTSTYQLPRDAAEQDGRLVVTVAGANPRQVREAVAGLALTVTALP